MDTNNNTAPLLAGKNILITGLLSDRSIAYGVAASCYKHGANLAFTYQSERFLDRAINFAREFGSDIVIPLDVSSDEQINNLPVALSKHWKHVNGALHSMAFSPKEGLSGDFVENVNRNTFTVATDISAYSFTAMARALKPMMQDRAGSLITLTYLGSNKVVENYNMAGVAKAALESTTKYMAYYLGEHSIRVNAISAGPIKTLAASGIGGFSKILDHVQAHAPLKRNVTIHEVGNTAVFLFSDLSSGITGDILYVDAGYNIISAGL